MVSNFHLVFRCNSLKTKAIGKRKYFQAQRHGEQSAVLDGNNVNKLYNEQVEYIEICIIFLQTKKVQV